MPPVTPAMPLPGLVAIVDRGSRQLGDDGAAADRDVRAHARAEIETTQRGGSIADRANRDRARALIVGNHVACRGHTKAAGCVHRAAIDDHRAAGTEAHRIAGCRADVEGALGQMQLAAQHCRTGLAGDHVVRVVEPEAGARRDRISRCGKHAAAATETPGQLERAVGQYQPATDYGIGGDAAHGEVARIKFEHVGIRRALVDRDQAHIGGGTAAAEARIARTGEGDAGARSIGVGREIERAVVGQIAGNTEDMSGLRAGRIRLQYAAALHRHIGADAERPRRGLLELQRAGNRYRIRDSRSIDRHRCAARNRYRIVGSRHDAGGPGTRRAPQAGTERAVRRRRGRGLAAADEGSVAFGERIHAPEVVDAAEQAAGGIARGILCRSSDETEVGTIGRNVDGITVFVARIGPVQRHARGRNRGECQRTTGRIHHRWREQERTARSVSGRCQRWNGAGDIQVVHRSCGGAAEGRRRRAALRRRDRADRADRIAGGETELRTLRVGIRRTGGAHAHRAINELDRAAGFEQMHLIGEVGGTASVEISLRVEPFHDQFAVRRGADQLEMHLAIAGMRALVGAIRGDQRLPRWASGSYNVVDIAVAPKRSEPFEFTLKRSCRMSWKKKSNPIRVTAEAVSS